MNPDCSVAGQSPFSGDTASSGNLPQIVDNGQLVCQTAGMAPLLEEIKRAVESSGKTRYRIAKESGVSASLLSRLMNGQRGLSVETVELLAAHLGLEIVVRKRKRKER